MMKLSPLDIQHQEFNKQAFGYSRQQVRDYLHNISQAFASQLAEINHLQQELLRQAEEIESLKLREDALEKDRHLFEDYRFAEVENAEKELENLRKRAEEDIELQRQQFATEMAKQKAEAYSEIRKIRESREGSLHDLREERDGLARDISLLRQLRSKSVRHMQLFQQQSQLLLAFVEDTSQGLEPPPELLDYLDVASVSKAKNPEENAVVPSDNLDNHESSNHELGMLEPQGASQASHTATTTDKDSPLARSERPAKALAKEYHMQEASTENIESNGKIAPKDISKGKAKEFARGFARGLRSSSDAKAKDSSSTDLSSSKNPDNNPDNNKGKIRYKSLYSALNAKPISANVAKGLTEKAASIAHSVPLDVPLDDDDGVVIDVGDDMQENMSSSLPR